MNQQQQDRKKKLQELENLGYSVYSSCENVKFSAAEIINKYQNETKENLEVQKNQINLAGRLKLMRTPFWVIEDNSEQIQLYLSKEFQKQHQKLLNLYDLGDIFYVEGMVSKSNKNQIIVKVDILKILVKALHPLPEKFHGLTDTDERFRKRYLDLIMNKKVKNIFKKKSEIIKIIRHFFDSQNYLEVDTPILQKNASGGAAKPFLTHYNALKEDFFLRIATEIPLKKLIVGNLERVYEIGKIFRNEGIDVTHNPEFTSIEFYEAYAGLEKMMFLTEKLFSQLGKKFGYQKKFQNHIINLEKPFKKIDMYESLSIFLGLDTENVDFETLKNIAKKLNIKVENFFQKGHLIAEIFAQTIEKKLIEPTFVCGHPIEISPLAKVDPTKKFKTLRCELFIGGKEFANMFSEINDPRDQLKRFINQKQEKQKGNLEAADIDYDFIEALEYGMPPTGGCGIGIDRLLMLFLEQNSIREVIFFPQLKNKKT